MGAGLRDSGPAPPTCAIAPEVRRALAFVPLLALACAKKPGVATSASAPSSAAAEVAPPPLAAIVPREATWPEDVRRGRWQDAARGLDALPGADRQKPEIRFVRAFVAKRLGDDAAVVALLEGLALPAVDESVKRLRAEAQLVAGPYEEAARYLEARGGAKELVAAATAYERGAKPADARRVADRAVSAAKGPSEPSARAVRMRLAEAAGDKTTAISDARWLAERAPEIAEALAVLERLSPSFRLSGQDREARAEKLAEAGRVDAALTELELSRTAPSPSSPAEARHARGMVLFKGRRYAEAADVLAKAKSPDTAEDDAFYAARALSRAHRDAEAIPRYDAIARGGGSHADEAEYLAARLSMLLGRTDDARKRYSAYLRAAKPGKSRARAEQELALLEVTLAPASARRRLERLADAEKTPAEAARLRELQGVAALASGDRDGAASLFVDVLRAQPLSFAALAARARLVGMGREAPPIFEPSQVRASAPIAPTLPTGPSLLRALGLERLAEESLRGLEGDVASAFKGREAEALCSVYGQLEPAGRRYRLAQRDVKVETLFREPGASNRWAWDCLFPRPYPSFVAEVEQREKLPRGLVHAVMRQESSFDPEVVSPARAVGLMQLLPSTAREIAKRSDVPFDDGWLTDAHVNVDLGARYLSLLLSTFRGNVALAVASYNAGPKAVSSWLKGQKDGQLDLFVANIPYAETRVYVGRVLANQARYAYLEGGPAAVPPLPLEVPDGLVAPDDAF